MNSRTVPLSALVAAVLASIGLASFVTAQVYEQPAPDRTIQAATRPAAPATVTRTVVTPAPEPTVVTQQVEVPVVPQACKDAINQTTSALEAIGAQWNNWVAAHAGGATAEDYQAIAQAIIASGQGSIAQVAPVAAACLHG